MTDYTKLVEALRCCSKDKCGQCEYGRNRNRGLCVYSILDDASDAIDEIRKVNRELRELYEDAVRELPKLGEWEEIVGEDGCVELYQCSECNAIYGREWNYCPNCGAKMREVQE